MPSLSTFPGPFPTVIVIWERRKDCLSSDQCLRPWLWSLGSGPTWDLRWAVWSGSHDINLLFSSFFLSYEQQMVEHALQESWEQDGSQEIALLMQF